MQNNLPPDQEPIDTDTVNVVNHNKLIIPSVLGVILVLLTILLWVYRDNSTGSSSGPLISSDIDGKSEETQPHSSPSASPILFYELTIPYLREREYLSELGELERVSDNGSYTSYLTSYGSDGLKIYGLLTRPKGEEPEGGWPAIVFIHGYIPPKQYQTQTRYIDHVDSFARNGIVVFKIDLRGHGKSEGEPGGGYYSSDYVIDGLNAWAALQKSEFVNPELIGFWGHSMAGNVVARIAAARPEIKAVVIWAGAGYTYLDLREYGIQDSSYQPQPSDSERQRKRQLLRQTYGDPSADHPFWKMVAPTNYLSEFKGAIQLNHAVNDDVVSIEYSRNLDRLLDETAVPHQLNEYPSGGHNISGSSFVGAIQNSVDFFRKYLK